MEEKLKKGLDTLPERYIVNENATILFYPNGEKVVVKKSADDEFDAEKSFLWAYFLRNSGMTRTQANKYLRNVKETYLEEQRKKENIEYLKKRAESGDFEKGFAKVCESLLGESKGMGIEWKGKEENTIQR